MILPIFGSSQNALISSILSRHSSTRCSRSVFLSSDTTLPLAMRGAPTSSIFAGQLSLEAFSISPSPLFCASQLSSVRCNIARIVVEPSNPVPVEVSFNSAIRSVRSRCEVRIAQVWHRSVTSDQDSGSRGNAIDGCQNISVQFHSRRLQGATCRARQVSGVLEHG